MPARNQKSEIRNQKSEVRNQGVERETWSSDFRFLTSDFRLARGRAMSLKARRAATIAACSAALLLAAAGSQAQPGGAEPCRQGLLALVVMIEAEEHGRPYYQSKVKDVVESCGRPAAEQAANAA